MANHIHPGHALIDAAVNLCGSRYKLAKLIGVAESNLNAIYRGARDMPPLTAAKIAWVAKLDPRDAMAVAAIEAEKNPLQRLALKALFFPNGDAAMLRGCIKTASAQPSNNTDEPAGKLTTYK